MHPQLRVRDHVYVFLIEALFVLPSHPRISGVSFLRGTLEIVEPARRTLVLAHPAAILGVGDAKFAFLLLLLHSLCLGDWRTSCWRSDFFRRESSLVVWCCVKLADSDATTGSINPSSSLSARQLRLERLTSKELLGRVHTYAFLISVYIEPYSFNVRLK